MSKAKEAQVRGKSTRAFKLEAIRLVKGGQSVGATARVLGMPEQTLGNPCASRIFAAAPVQQGGGGSGGEQGGLLGSLFNGKD